MTQVDDIDKAIYSGAKAIARWLQAPGGGGSFENAVIEHLVWFQGAQARGMKCGAIISVLYTAGIKRKSGLPLSEHHVRGVLSRRQQKKIPGKKEALQALMERYGPKPTVGRRQGSVVRSKDTAAKSDAVSPAPATSQGRRAANRAGPLNERQGARPGVPAGNENAATNTISYPNEIRSRMKRDEVLRRRAEED